MATLHPASENHSVRKIPHVHSQQFAPLLSSQTTKTNTKTSTKLIHPKKIPHSMGSSNKTKYFPKGVEALEVANCTGAFHSGFGPMLRQLSQQQLQDWGTLNVNCPLSKFMNC